jgi:raffinose/stachyose/melibiose transport system permease protein
MTKYRNNWKAILLFLLPAFLIYTGLEIIPIGQTIYFSLFDWIGIQGVPMKFVGLKNFVHLFQYPEFYVSLKNIAWFLVLSLLTQIPIGYLLAFLLTGRVRGSRLFKSVFFMPVVLPITAVGMIWYFILMPNDGVLNTILAEIGQKGWQHAWLVDKSTALNSLILITTWISVPFYLIIGYAAITGIPEEVMDASSIDGAVGIKRTFHIVIPMIRESIRISIVLVITGILKIFDIVFIMTEGGPNGLTHVPVTLLYYEAFKYNNFGIGNAIAIVVFLMSILLSFLALKLTTPRDDKT